MKTLISKSWFKFFPFFVLYVIICVTNQQNIFFGDEFRYWAYAGKLLEGGFALDGNDYLWSGPGYPIFLVPFKLLNTPLIIPKLFNAIFLYLAIILFYNTLVLYVNKSKAYWLTVLIGLYYPNFMYSLPVLLTEALAFFCSCSFVYFTCKGIKTNKFSYIVLSAFSLAYLSLVKVIFGYVLLSLSIGLLCYFLISKNKQKVKPYGYILGLSIIFCSPYLFYTYNLTGKIYYWSNAGSMSLYWMSSPFEDELGDWHSFSLKENKQLEINHGDYVNSIANLSPVNKDEELKIKAMDNIFNNKKKFIYNWVANISRIFFSYPLSFFKPSNAILYYLLPNIFLIVFLFISGILTIIKMRTIPSEILFLVSVSLIYLFGISLLASEARFLYLIIPLLLIWIIYVMDKFVSIDLK